METLAHNTLLSGMQPHALVQPRGCMKPRSLSLQFIQRLPMPKGSRQQIVLHAVSTLKEMRLPLSSI